MSMSDRGKRVEKGKWKKKNYTECKNECQIVFGGDCFDQFASDFDDNSLKSLAI